jgi:subtilase family serine protease
MRILAAAFVGLMGLSPALLAQGPVRDRILEAVDVSKVTTVGGNVHPMARAEFDQGRVDPSMVMRLTITFKMTAAQEADLNALLAAQQDRGSADYHRWLTPEQFGNRFGLSQSDIGKVTAWLQSEGFRIEGVPPSRNMITFSGSAQQVESALHTEIHRYLADGKQHYANASNPSVPAAIGDVVLGFRGLNNFQLKPRPLKKETPKFSSGVSGNHFITPPDFSTIYDVAPLYHQGLHGEGQKIVVVGQSDVALSDVRAFRTNSGLPANDPQPTNSSTSPNCPCVGLVVPGEADPGLVSGDIDEASLDVEWAGAIAYNATVIFVVGNPNNGGVVDAMNYAITANLAPVISTSYGACEPSFSSTDIDTLQNLLQQANAQGITVLAPAGDTGAADCDFNTNPNSPVTTSTMGLAVDLPGAFQQVTSVGGTEFSEGADTASVYWQNPPCVLLNACSSATASEDVTPASAKSYIPEGAWNDTNTVVGGTSVGLSAGGGGASASIPKPAWQAGTGVPNDGARDVPDISFSASQLHDAYLICSENFNASANPQFSPTCTNGFRNASDTLAAVGGTSVGPPAMAGIVALINQATNHAQGSGNINPVLYPLAAHGPAAFHDVTSGNNMVPFSPPCVASTQIGYNAGTGYDLATGLGSIDAANLVSTWTSVAPASTANATSSVDFSIAFAQGQVTVKRGSCGTGTLILTRLNGFAGTPKFTCTVTATLGATTCAIVPAASAGFDPPARFEGLKWLGILAIAVVLTAPLASLMFGRHERRKPKWRPRIAFGPAFAVLTFAIMIGCGGSSNSGNSAADPQVDYMFAVQVPSTAPVATGTASVNAAIGGLSHTAQITLTTQ